MKPRSFTDVVLKIYINCWYIPLFAFLLGIKLCLVSMLADTIHRGEQNRYEEIVSDEMHRMASSMKSKAFLRKHHHYDATTSSTTTTATVSPELQRDWKILEDLENSFVEPTATNRTDPDSIWVIYNRIPRCGGESMVQLLHKLGDENGFTHQEHEYRTPWPRFLLEQEQENLVTWFEYQHLPKSYDRHFYFVNFTSYQKYVKERPIYINIIRDPALRLKSFYQTKRAVPEIAKLEIERRNEIQPSSGLEWYRRSFETCVQLGDSECNYETGNKDFTLMVPFFCGQHPSCVIINNKWAIQRAKFTIEKYYSVVVVLEQWNATLTVLEKFIPKFFQGSTQLYYENTKVKPHQRSRSQVPRVFSSTTAEISPVARSILERKLHGEFELYRFALQRLKYQTASLN